MSRVIKDFESPQELVMNISKQEEQEQQEDLRHHEQIKGVQNTFWNQVNAVCSTIEEIGNPFADQTRDLLVLDTRDIADSKVIETLRTVEQLGNDQEDQGSGENNTTVWYNPEKQLATIQLLSRYKREV